MEFASANNIAVPHEDLPIDEDGNIIPEMMPPATGADKKAGLQVVLIGLACSFFVAYKIKKKVEEINKAADEAKKED